MGTSFRQSPCMRAWTFSRSFLGAWTASQLPSLPTIDACARPSHATCVFVLRPTFLPPLHPPHLSFLPFARLFHVLCAPGHRHAATCAIAIIRFSPSLRRLVQDVSMDPGSPPFRNRTSPEDASNRNRTNRKHKPWIGPIHAGKEHQVPQRTISIARPVLSSPLHGPYGRSASDSSLLICSPNGQGRGMNPTRRGFVPLEPRFRKRGQETSPSLVVDRCASLAHHDVASKHVLAHVIVFLTIRMRDGRRGGGVRRDPWSDVGKEGEDEAVRKLDGS